MKLTQSIAIALGAMALALTPAIADAKRIYFLVGVRHVYRIGPDRDLYVDQREDIEKTYADGVASDEATYQQHVTDGADPAAESKSRDEDLELLAEDRDKSLGALFDMRDDLRAAHPEFDIKGDGPYQVIGVEYHTQSDVVVYDSFCVFAPWPGYVVVGRPYGGWAYGTWYTPGVFVSVYSGWSSSFGIGIGVPLFWGGFVGHAGPVPFHGGVFAGQPHAWIHPGGYYHAVGVRQGFIGTRGFVHGGSGGVNRGAAAPGHGAAGGFIHPSGGYTHSGSRSTGTPGGARGWGDARRSEGTSRTGAGADHGAWGSHSSGSSSSDHGSSSHSSGSGSSDHGSGGHSSSSHGGGYSHSHSSSHSSSHGDSHGGSSSHDSHDHH